MPVSSKKDSNNNQSPKKSTATVIPPPVPPKIYPKLIDQTPSSTVQNQTSVTAKPQIYDAKKTEEKNIDKIKRNKKKVPRLTEQDARQILETMVTPGDPHDKYILKDKLGSG